MPFTIDENGVQTQTTAEVIAEFNAKLQDPDEGFGTDFVIDDDEVIPRIFKPIAEVVSLVQGRVKSAIAALTAGAATGVFATNIASLSGVERRGATYSTVMLELEGLSGSTIPAGRVVRHNPSGTLWDLPEAIPINGSGIAYALAYAQNTGPISIAPSDDWTVVLGDANLTSVVSSEASEPGRVQESDEALESRRRTDMSSAHSVTARGIKAGVVEALKEAGYDAVDAVTVYLNPRSVLDAFGRPPGSAEVLLDDNNAIPDAVIADAIWSVVAGGIEPWGTTFVAHVDEAGQTQQVGFSRPTGLDVHLRVTIETAGADAPLGSSEAALQEAITAALVAYAEANHPSGRNIVPVAFIPTVLGQLVAGSFVGVTVEESTDGATWSTSQLDISPRDEARFAAERVTVNFT